MALPQSGSLDTYGGILQDAFPIVDPETEISANSLNQLRSDAANMTRVSVRARFQFLGSASAPVLASTSTWATGFDSVWGTSDLAEFPTLGRTSTGVFTVTFPVSITDDLGNTVLINLRGGSGQVNDSTLGHVQVKINSSNTATIYCFNAAGTAASDLVGSLIGIEVF